MTKWILEPGHSAAQFCVRHMMITWVKGHIKDVHGVIDFDPESGSELSLNMSFDLNKLWSGEPNRDAHLLTEDFLWAEKFGTLTFRNHSSERVGARDYRVVGELEMRGVKKEVELELQWIGKWNTSYWTDEGKEFPVQRVGFAGSARLNRNDFGVDWNSPMEGGGLVVGNDVFIELDLEGLLEKDMQSLSSS